MFFVQFAEAATSSDLKNDKEVKNTYVDYNLGVFAL
jgi:hypothetical protein